MTRPQNGFLRFCVILLGYLAACYMAGLTLQLVILLDDNRSLADFSENWPGLVFTPLFIAPFIAFLAAIPAAFAIAAGEFIPRRDWQFYTLGGLITGALLCGFFAMQEMAAADGEQGVDILFVAIMLCGGTAAGFTYWAVAGRRAGAAREDAATSPAP